MEASLIITIVTVAIPLVTVTWRIANELGKVTLELARINHALEHLSHRIKKIAKKLLIFTVMKEEGLMGLAKLQFVGYTRAELDELLSSVGLVANTINTQVDLGEYVVICNINS
jgi:hypothetical protein